MKTTLIVFAVIAAVLGAITAIVVFYPTGSYQPVITIKGPLSSTTAIGIFPMNTASTTATTTTSTTTSGTVNGPYAVSWNGGHGQFSVTKASLKGKNLTLSLAIKSGDASSCAPSGVRLAADESGTLKAPDSQTCSGNGTDNNYNELLVFTVDSSMVDFIFTTGGTANIFFTVSPNAAGGMDVAIPEKAG